METKYAPADWAVPISTFNLRGTLVALEPLRPSHVDELAVAGSDPRVWQYTTSCADSPQAMEGYVSDLLRDWEAGRAAPFAVRRNGSHQIVGCTRLKELDRKHRHAVLGSWYAPQAWRTGANLEAKFLLLRFAFEELGLIRVEFHTDARNSQSRASLEKLGATYEGLLRAHQITRDGGLRDSAYYSVLASEWPQVRERIRSRLR